MIFPAALVFCSLLLFCLRCKFNKHESKDDEEDDVLEEGRRGAEGGGKEESKEGSKKSAKVRCFACKEIGHKAKDCPRDPNLRTGYTEQKELRRIDQVLFVLRGILVKGC